MALTTTNPPLESAPIAAPAASSAVRPVDLHPDTRQADVSLLLATETVQAEPSAREMALLVALSEASIAWRTYRAELDLEVQRRREEARLARAQGRPEAAFEGWGKTERQTMLEEKARQAKATMATALRALAAGQMYTSTQIIRLAEGLASRDVLRPAQSAIGQADVTGALDGYDDQLAIRCFLRRWRHKQDTEDIALALSIPEFRVRVLSNRALRFVQRSLNKAVVAATQQKYAGVCLAYGLEFPDYDVVEGTEGGTRL